MTHKFDPTDVRTFARAMSSLLGASEPAALARLRQAYPAVPDLFDTTYVLGPGAGDATEGDTRQEALKALIEATLQASDRRVTVIVQSLSARMRRVRSIRLAAALLTTVAGTLTAAPALGAALPVPALVGPGMALLGAIFMLVAEHADKPLAGTQRGLAELLADTLVAEAAFVEARLRMVAEDLSRDGALLELARRVSEASAKLRHVSVFGGLALPANPHPVQKAT